VAGCFALQIILEKTQIKISKWSNLNVTSWFFTGVGVIQILRLIDRMQRGGDYRVASHGGETPR